MAFWIYLLNIEVTFSFQKAKDVFGVNSIHTSASMPSQVSAKTASLSCNMYINASECSNDLVWDQSTSINI